MNQSILDKKLEIIEQSRQYIHRMIDAQYDEFIRQSQGSVTEEMEEPDEEVAPQLTM